MVEVSVIRGYCFELDSVYGYKLGAVEVKAHAEFDELSKYAFDKVYVVFAKVGYGFEVWSELFHEPHRLKVAVAFALEFSACSNLVQVPVDVEFEQV